MGLILLEALAALLLLVGIVWWTMFAGRSRGELDADDSIGEKAEHGQPDAEDAEVLQKSEKSEK